MGAPRGSAEVVSIARATYRPGYKRLASGYVARARETLGMPLAEFAAHLTTLLGWPVTPEIVERWEQGGTPIGDAALACEAIAGGVPEDGPSLLDPVPPGFPVDALTGSWVTAYQFNHAGVPHYHADIAHVTADDEWQIRAVNHPPAPRTQGRAVPFRNEIEARLFGRHLIGTWRNMSDTRYYGTLQLAVLPGETVMDGFYTGLASDIAVSTQHWKWVRLDESGALDGLTLHEPSVVHELVMTRTQDDPPLTAADIGEEG